MNRITVFFLILTLAFPLSANDDLTKKVWSNRAEEFVMAGWEFDIGNTLESVKKLGRLREDKVSQRRSPGGGDQWDEVHDLHFYGLRVVMVFPGKNLAAGWLERIEVASQNYPMKWGLKVHSTLEQIIQELGQPDKSRMMLVQYETGSNRVVFHLHNGVVKSIEWVFNGK